MEKFARLMARVPANKAKLRRFSEKSFKAAADENAGLRSPYPTLSQTTIVRQYFMPIKAAFAWMCKKHKILSPFAGEKLKAPRGARLAEPRRPLTVPEFVAVLSEAAQRPRPDERWLPLLGYATGCRLGELVYLQGRDLRWRRDAKAWTFDLRDTLLVNGRSVERPLKTEGSRRVIALPAFLVETGFVEWARDREGFIFDELHRRSKDPSSAASKRMARLFTSAGVDDAGEVFHSLRHTTQDWLRGLKVDRRTRLLQGGWSLNGEDVAERYGLKHLRDDEIAELARCEPPPEIAEAAARYRRSR
jgi:integrase